jgi:hypothetical protein
MAYWLTGVIWVKYDKQDQQGKAAFNIRNPQMTQQQEPVARKQDRILGRARTG